MTEAVAAHAQPGRGPIDPRLRNPAPATRRGAWRAPVAGSALLLLAALAWPTVPDARAQEPGVRREGDLVYFNLQNVDIRSALESISEVLGISYVLGGSVPTGTPITINTSGGIAVEKVPDLLDSVLRTYNLALVRTGDVFTVISAQDQGQGAVPGAAPETRIFVYYLRNANAVDLANIMNQLFSGSAPPGGFQRRSESARSLSQQLREQRLDYQPFEDEEEEPVVVVQPELEQQQGVVAQQFIPGELVGQTSIVPDESTNSLIIRTAPQNYASIEETIRKLDVRPLQVLIEVTIAEITLDKSSQFGIDFLLRDKARIDGETVRGEAELLNATPFANGLRVRVFDAGNVDATFRALAADSRINVLSTPRILAINNQEARILVGQEVPFVQFQRSTIGDAVDQVTQFRNVGLELTVTPRINPDRYVSMDLLQQVSSLSPDVLFDAPIITTREAETSLVVGDRQTVVLGGLIEDRKEKRRNGIPILKDIPILGLLFGSNSTRTVKSELVITLTPYIVGTDLELQDVRRELESGTDLYRKELERRREEGDPVPGSLGPSGPDTMPPPIAPPPPGTPDSLVPSPLIAPPSELPPAGPEVTPADTAGAPYVPPTGPPEMPRTGSSGDPLTPVESAPDSVTDGEPAPSETPSTQPAPAPGPEAPGAEAGRETANAEGGRATAGAEAVRETAGLEAGRETAGVEADRETGASGNHDAARVSNLERALSDDPPPDPPPAADGVLMRAAWTPAGPIAARAATSPSPVAEAQAAERLSYRIQVTAEADLAEAEHTADILSDRLEGRAAVYVEFETPFYKVRVGDFATRHEAGPLVQELRGMGYADAWAVESEVTAGDR